MAFKQNWTQARQINDSELTSEIADIDLFTLLQFLPFWTQVILPIDILNIILSLSLVEFNISCTLYTYIIQLI